METLYTKHGRRYRVWGNADWSVDVMKAGEYRLVYCSEDGCTRYGYEIKPDLAPSTAALTTIHYVMEQAILEKAKYSPSKGTQFYTEEQQNIIKKFRDDMAATGALVPDYWTSSSAYEIALAGIDALRKFVD